MDDRAKNSPTPTAIVSDPAWKFGDGLPGKSRGASKNYGCLTVPEIVSVMSPHCQDANAVMFMWRVAAMQREALQVLDALGFTPKTEMVWEKLTNSGKAFFGMGRYVRASHETCLIAVKGRAFPEARNVRSRFSAPVREHSRKPGEFYALVEQMYPSSRKVELFARIVRAGWEQHGLELGKFQEAV